ncbi:MAG TPA: ABC transporter permease [Chitinophagaceae bacterium]|nr:ABC transporter permease [Chitinophagaceae bacterium]
MFKNYFKIAWRSFIKDKVYATINLTGLVIALAGVLMIAAYVKYELSFDRYYSNSNRIYRVVAEEKRDSLFEKTFSMPDALAYTLKNEFPEIESVTKISETQNDFVVNGKNIQVKYLMVDSSFFKMFNLPFVLGDAASSLINNNSIVLTESLAKKLFPSENTIGRKLNYKGYTKVNKPFTVTGIIKDIPTNTHFQAEAIVANTETQEPLDWRGFGTRGVKYIMLKRGEDIDALDKKIPSIYEKYYFRKDTKIVFQPVTSIHLHSHIKNEPFPTGDIKYIYIFSFVALLILFIACINYINLTTARSLQRVKEVGIRKVMGAGKKQLAFQFVSESVLLFCVALPVALFITYLLWPLFAKIVDINADKLLLLNWKFIVAIFLLSIATGAISGSYPAFFLSRLHPVGILQDKQKSFSINLNIRKTLIVFQFVISIGLIVATIVVYKQLYLLNNMQLGFNKNYLITLPFQNFQDKASSFKNELKTGKDIVDVSFSNWTLGGYGHSSSMSRPDDSTKNWNFGFVDVDADFLNTMQIKLIAGKNFSHIYSPATDNIDSLAHPPNKKLSYEEYRNIISSRPIIITKATAENLGFKQPVIGQVLKLGALQGTVVGEINDFIGISLLEKSPMVVVSKEMNLPFGNTYIRINSKNIPETIDFIKSKWKQFFPDSDFSFSFMDDDIANLYKSQQRLAKLFTTFATLAILISLLGLFSLVALIAQQRTKEIGIRKVLGASVPEIVSLLSGSFVELILLAFIIATPIVWWAMNNWLQDFQYRITISWWIFLIAGLGSLVFALTVVAIQAIKAAIANPIKSLRTE